MTRRKQKNYGGVQVYVGGTSTTEEERGRILAAASKCVRQYGFQNTTLETVGRKGSVTPAQMHRNFPDMEVIVAALAIDHLEVVETDIKSLGPDPDPIAIATVLQERARDWSANGDASVFFNLLAEVERNPLVGRVLRKRLYYVRDALSTSISKGQSHSTIHSGVDAGSYALLISVMAHASLIVRLLNTEVEAEQVDHLFMVMLNTALAGQAAPPVSSK